MQDHCSCTLKVGRDGVQKKEFLHTLTNPCRMSTPLLQEHQSSKLAPHAIIKKNELQISPRLLQFCVFFLGTATLVGWNTLLAAVDLFRNSFPNSPSAAVWFIWLFELATLATLLCVSQVGERFSFASRFAFGFSAVAFILLCVPLFIALLSERVAWTVCLLLMALLAIGSGIIEGSLWGFVSSYQMYSSAPSDNASTDGGDTEQDGQRMDLATPATAGQGFAGVHFLSPCVWQRL